MFSIESNTRLILLQFCRAPLLEIIFSKLCSKVSRYSGVSIVLRNYFLSESLQFSSILLFYFSVDCTRTVHKLCLYIRSKTENTSLEKMRNSSSREFLRARRAGREGLHRGEMKERVREGSEGTWMKELTTGYAVIKKRYSVCRPVGEIDFNLSADLCVPLFRYR